MKALVRTFDMIIVIRCSGEISLEDWAAFILEMFPILEKNPQYIVVELPPITSAPVLEKIVLWMKSFAKSKTKLHIACAKIPQLGSSSLEAAIKLIKIPTSKKIQAIFLLEEQKKKFETQIIQVESILLTQLSSLSHIEKLGEKPTQKELLQIIFKITRELQRIRLLRNSFKVEIDKLSNRTKSVPIKTLEDALGAEELTKMKKLEEDTLRLMKETGVI